MRNSPFSIGDTIVKATKSIFQDLFSKTIIIYVFKKVLRKGNSSLLIFIYLYLLPNILLPFFVLTSKIISLSQECHHRNALYEFFLIDVHII